jgi:hypothetical protein
MSTATGTGTREDPWILRTPPSASEYQMYRDEAADPPTLVCVVGKTLWPTSCAASRICRRC